MRNEIDDPLPDPIAPEKTEAVSSLVKADVVVPRFRLRRSHDTQWLSAFFAGYSTSVVR